MSWGIAVAFFLGLLKMLLKWLGFAQTRELGELEEEADEAAEKKREAMDADPPDLDAADHWTRELMRLHAEISAKRGR